MSQTENQKAGVVVSPIAGHIGAEISGVGLSHDLSDAGVRQIREALLQHGTIARPRIWRHRTSTIAMWNECYTA